MLGILRKIDGKRWTVFHVVKCFNRRNGSFSFTPLLWRRFATIFQYHACLSNGIPKRVAITTNLLDHGDYQTILCTYSPSLYVYWKQTNSSHMQNHDRTIPLQVCFWERALYYTLFIRKLIVSSSKDMSNYMINGSGFISPDAKCCSILIRPTHGNVLFVLKQYGAVTSYHQQAFIKFLRFYVSSFLYLPKYTIVLSPLIKMGGFFFFLVLFLNSYHKNFRFDYWIYWSLDILIITPRFLNTFGGWGWGWWGCNINHRSK